MAKESNLSRMFPTLVFHIVSTDEKRYIELSQVFYYVDTLLLFFTFEILRTIPSYYFM